MPHPKGGYKLRDGTKVPGVTTILGRFKESGGLLHWAFEQGQSCERGEISDLYDKRDEAASAGTLAHSMVERHINGEDLPDLTTYSNEVAAAATQGYENYIRWADDNRMVIVDQEMELVSERYAFGGCPDAIATNSKSQICLLDWKTSSGIYVDYLCQCAAYKILWEENRPEQPITGGIHLLRFSKENADFHHHFWNDLSEAGELFILLRRAYDLDKKLKKRI